MRTMRIAVPVLLTLATVWGCKPKAEPPAGVDPPAPVAPAAAVVAVTEDTTGCGFVPRMAHANANELMAEYLRRDGDGDFTHSDSWRDEAMACPAHAPGWDGFTLISSYKSEPLASGSVDTARFVVRYTRIGLLEQDANGFMIRTDAGQEVDTVSLSHTAYGWRINDWDEEPHLLPVGALTLARLRAEDKQRLRQLRQ